MARLFGTDGVRGLANRDITAELALDLAVSAARVLAERGEFSGHRPRAILGRDTRLSSQFLSSAVAAGLASAGVDVLDLGAIPTPAVAHLTETTGADLGVVISASHNPMPDNGIKFFARGGVKLPDSVEETIEARIGETWERPTGADVGDITLAPELVETYAAHLAASAQDFAGHERPLSGLTIVVDGAHGAAHAIGPAALEAAGALVVRLNCAPDGRNINANAGSTYLGPLAEAVVSRGADMGVAYDGDADRCLAIDHTGEVVNGDLIMGLLAIAMRDNGSLYHNALVATVMSNLGLHHAMRDAGIDIVETAVGDRYVLEAMREGGYTLGGEQSGHIIVSRYASTGDGVLCSLLLGSLVAKGTSLRDLAAGISTLPQVLINVPNVDRSRVHTDVELSHEVDRVRQVLGDDGRVLLRSSGTEPLVRVMVEAATMDDARKHADSLAATVADRLAL